MTDFSSNLQRSEKIVKKFWLRWYVRSKELRASLELIIDIPSLILKSKVACARMRRENQIKRPGKSQIVKNNKLFFQIFNGTQNSNFLGRNKTFLGI